MDNLLKKDYSDYISRCVSINDEIEAMLVTNEDELERAWNWANSCNSHRTVARILQNSDKQTYLEIMQYYPRKTVSCCVNLGCYLTKDTKDSFDTVSIEDMGRYYTVTKPAEVESHV
jgi:hypothetical protein